ncbi:MAG: hypothetical protein LBJ04_16150 [Sphingobacterium sp.]|jgi:hypothetical protein|nr:hypothetical protein [Sphingobacterium sp.]
MKKDFLKLDHFQKGITCQPSGIPLKNSDGVTDEDAVGIHKTVFDTSGYKIVKYELSSDMGLLSYRTYAINCPATFCSRISEESVCIRFQLYNSSVNGFVSEISKVWDQNNCFLFWNRGSVLESHLTNGYHMQLDLFIKKEQLQQFSDWVIISEILDEEHPSGKDRIHWLGKFTDIGDMILDMILELTIKDSISKCRFNLLFTNLLLLCLGDKNVSSSELGFYKKETDDTILDSPFRKQQSCELDGLNRHELIQSLFCFLNITKDLQKKWNKDEDLSCTLSETVREVCGSSQEALGTAYIEIAYFLDYSIRQKIFDREDRIFLQTAIEKACRLSFEFRSPSIHDRLLLMKWENKIKDNVTGKQGPLEDLSGLLDSTGPEGFTEIDPPATEHGNHVGSIMKGANFNRKFCEGEEEKPLEVVNLYRIVMEHFLKNMKLDHDGIKITDIIRDIDDIFEENDSWTLMQYELEYVVDSVSYLEKYDDERLKLLFFVTRSLYEDYSMLNLEMETDLSYFELQKFRELEENMQKFEDWAHVQQQLLFFECSKLLNELSRLRTEISRTKIMDFARIFSSVGSYRGIYPTIW